MVVFGALAPHGIRKNIYIRIGLANTEGGTKLRPVEPTIG